jgi:hypothetical protein
MIRRPGRPPLDVRDPSITVGFRVPTKKYDEFYAHARAARMSVSEYLRDQLSTKRRPSKIVNEIK